MRILNDLSLDAQFETSNKEKCLIAVLFNTLVSLRRARQVMKQNGRPGERISNLVSGRLPRSFNEQIFFA